MTVYNPPVCRSCAATTVETIGKLPEAHIFAGRRLQSPLVGGELWRCLNCAFQFRDPVLTDEAYEGLYGDGALGVWDTEQPRKDFDLIRHSLKECDGRAIEVLDVGCYTGQLLSLLPRSFRLFGVETNKEAGRVAASRGVRVIAPSVRELSRETRRYDVITACDVIEHLPDPMDFLMTLKRSLKPGGRILISTANCDSWLWRVLGSRYWYCSFPEHISFIGTRWVRTQPGRAGLKLTGMTYFNYVGGRLRLGRIAQSFIYRISPLWYRKLRALMGRPLPEDAVPGNGATRDHMLCIFEST